MKQQRRKYLLPGEKNGEPTPWKTLAFCGLPCIAGLGVAIYSGDWDDAYFGLILISVIVSFLLFGAVRTLLTGTFVLRQFTTQEGIYQRSQQPFRYWLYTFILVAATVAAAFGWWFVLRRVWTGSIR